MDLNDLTRVIVAAKLACYVGGGTKVAASRTGSHDLVWADGPWSYRDSYFGGTDFLGQETVWHADEPVWAMNYYGFITRPDLIDAERAGATIKAALSAMYAKGRFLGGFEWTGPFGAYRDGSEGDVGHFTGREAIVCDGVEAYALHYFGGLIRP
ncbi:DUF5680 domain-containing protein [Devosia sp.]|uniref:DUF5680 domain-containing protein n=1 Tax=Devosia sp. TaxID=1871048 RepID=UPI00326537E9